MRLDWKRTTLGNLQAEGLAELQTGPFGTVLKASEYSEKGVPVISVGEIREGYIQIHDRTPFVSSDVTTKLSKYVLKEGDIVFGRKGSIERNAIINKDQDGWFLGSDGIRLRLNKAINSVFLSYQLRQKSNQKWLMSNGVGSTMPSLNQKILDRLPIWLPAKNEQDIIAKLLSDLDAKIEFNNKINAELEGMAKLIYDYWFVQFDFPYDFRQGKPADETSNAKDVKPYKSSGGKMLWNKELKREVPEGWRSASLLDIAIFDNGLACQKFRPMEGENSYPVIKIREMRDGITPSTERASIKIPKKNLIDYGDILFSWSASLEVMQWTGGKGALNQHIFKVHSKKYPKSFYYMEVKSYLKHFKMIAELRKTTMGHITIDHLKQSRIVLPPFEIIKELDKLLEPIFEQQLVLDKQNQELSEKRDWLLPMLMNGQVRVEGDYELKDSEIGMAAEPKEKYY